MEPRITARHFSASDGLRAHVSQSLSKLSQYYDGIQDAHVTLDSSPLSKTAEVKVKVYRQTLTARDTAASYEEAVAKCAKRLRRQVIRFKSKRHGR